MVDALLSAAAESDSQDDVLMMRSHTNDEFITINSRGDLPAVRFCEFCNSSTTPTWRRGPAGKGSLCNACGIKWRLHKRTKKNEKGSSPLSPPTIEVSPITFTSAPVRPKKRKAPSASSFSATKFIRPNSSGVDFKRKKYYCKYCDQTFSMSQFRNSQQFGAHCSNCSRRPRSSGEEDNEGMYTYRYDSSTSPSADPNVSSPESNPTPPSPSPNSNGSNNRDGLLLRLLHVVEHQLVDVHELAEIRDELSTLKTELISRDEARRVELGVLRARFRDDLADLKTGLRRSVAASEQLAAHRLMEMEQTIRVRGGLLF